ncbi:hypothetical protein P8452_22567 [Trifolium repens]|nr:hypothetical protein P8452_22567 [Trifolium repens]
MYRNRAESATALGLILAEPANALGLIHVGPLLNATMVEPGVAYTYSATIWDWNMHLRQTWSICALKVNGLPFFVQWMLVNLLNATVAESDAAQAYSAAVGIGICIICTEWINRHCGVDVGGPRGSTTLWNSSSDVAAACTAATAKGLCSA